MSYVTPPEPPIVAIVYEDDYEREEYDKCFSWEAGQNYSNQGYRVVAVADDGIFNMKDAQTLYDYERRIAADCFGPGIRS